MNIDYNQVSKNADAPYLTYDIAVHIAKRKKFVDVKTILQLCGKNLAEMPDQIERVLATVSLGTVYYNELHNSYIINLASTPSEDIAPEIAKWPISLITSWILVRPEDMLLPDTKLYTMQGATLLESLVAIINQPINTIKEMHADLEVQTKLIAKMQEKLGTWEKYEGKTITN